MVLEALLITTFKSLVYHRSTEACNPEYFFGWVLSNRF